MKNSNMQTPNQSNSKTKSQSRNTSPNYNSKINYKLSQTLPNKSKSKANTICEIDISQNLKNQQIADQKHKVKQKQESKILQLQMEIQKLKGLDYQKQSPTHHIHQDGPIPMKNIDEIDNSSVTTYDSSVNPSKTQEIDNEQINELLFNMEMNQQREVNRNRALEQKMQEQEKYLNKDFLKNLLGEQARMEKRLAQVDSMLLEREEIEYIREENHTLKQELMELKNENKNLKALSTKNSEDGSSTNITQEKSFDETLESLRNQLEMDNSGLQEKSEIDIINNMLSKREKENQTIKQNKDKDKHSNHIITSEKNNNTNTRYSIDLDFDYDQDYVQNKNY